MSDDTIRDAVLGDKTYSAEKEETRDGLSFDTFFDLNLDLLCIADTDGRFIKLNRFWEECLGYPIEELEGRFFMEFVHPDDVALTVEALSQLENQKQVLNFTNRYLSKNGEWRYIEWRSQPYGKLIYAAARDITDKISAEKALSDSEGNFRNLFETIDDVIVVGNNQGEIIYANSATVNKLGYSMEELKTMHVIELNAKIYRDEAAQIFGDMLAGKRNYCPLPLERKDGSLLPVETRVWFGNWSGTECIMGISKDLSIRQAALDRFTKMFNSNPVLMAISNFESREFTDINNTFLEKLGYNREEVIGKTSAELNLFSNSQKMQQTVKNLQKTGDIKNILLQVRKKNGELMDGLFSGVIIDNQIEKSLMSVMIDVTDLNRAEAEKARQSALILALIDSTPDLIFYKDRAGTYIGCNTRFAELVGKPREFIIGKTDKDLFDLKIAEEFVYNDEEMYKLGTPRHNEEWVSYADGRKLLVDTLKTPFYDADGNLAGMIGISRDITERKRREDSIQYLSFRDQLTGLYNRRFFDEEIIRLDTEQNLPLTIIMGDLNGLKFVNDSFGHEKGDELIKTAAEALKKSCRDVDIIARIGGDEFVIILPNSGAQIGRSVMERIISRLTEAKVEAVDVTISLGAATKTKMTQDIREIQKTAEDRMYDSKLNQRADLRNLTIKAIIDSLFQHDEKELLHSKRVAELCGLTAKALGLNSEEVKQFKLAGLMHDIGKFNIDRKILDKSTTLTAKEWEIIKHHSETGFRVLSSSAEFQHIAQYVCEHHERWDGTGYPHKLKGDEISLPARVIALADAYDAMTLRRTYRPLLSNQEATEEIKRCAGTQFDPDIVPVFINKVIIQLQ